MFLPKQVRTSEKRKQALNKLSEFDYKSHNAKYFAPLHPEEVESCPNSPPQKWKDWSGQRVKRLFFAKHGNWLSNANFIRGPECARDSHWANWTNWVHVGGLSSRDARALRFVLHPIRSQSTSARGRKSGEDRPWVGLLPFPDTWNNRAGKQAANTLGQMC